MENNTNQAWKHYINTDTVIAFLRKCGIFLLYGACFEIVCANLLTFILQFVPKVSEEYSEHIDHLAGNINPTVVMVIGFLSPIFEELLFRGLILLGGIKILELLTKNHKVAFIIANIIQAVLFGLDHAQLVQSTYAVILGFFIGYLLEVSKNLLFTICFHSGLNICGLLLSVLMPVESVSLTKTVYIVISLVLIVVISMWIYKTYIKKNKTVQ